jgi:parallel beta-helix repeat protein
MSPVQTRAAVLAALLLASLAPGHAVAAQSYDNCTGFIESLPATISTPGTWCLRKDVATAMTQGAAISISSADVTLDCNHFKLGGLAAGAATKATGVLAYEASHVAVRRCNVRGFATGIFLKGGSGSRLEDNRLDGNTSHGLLIATFDGVVARNVIRDTGGSTAVPGQASGITAWDSVDIIDNTVSGVWALPDADGAVAVHGIRTYDAQGSHVAGNRVRGLPVPGPTVHAVALGAVSAVSQDVSGNELVGPGSVAIACGSANVRVSDNILSGFNGPMTNCIDAGDNDVSF